MHSQQHKGLKHQLIKEKLVNQNRRLAASPPLYVLVLVISAIVSFSSSTIPSFSSSLISLLHPFFPFSLSHNNMQDVYARVEELKQKNINLQRRRTSSLFCSLTFSLILSSLQSGKGFISKFHLHFHFPLTLLPAFLADPSLQMMSLATKCLCAVVMKRHKWTLSEKTAWPSMRNSRCEHV